MAAKYSHRYARGRLALLTNIRHPIRPYREAAIRSRAARNSRLSSVPDVIFLWQRNASKRLNNAVK